MKPALLLYPYVSSYSVLMLVGFVAGWILSRSRADLYGIRKQHLDNIALILPVAGLFGARFFARLFYAKLPLLEALKVWEGDGLVFYGGFFFGFGAVLCYGLARRIQLARLFDCLAPGLALGLAFGRVGCFLAGCCWGDVCLDRSGLAKLDPAVSHQIQTLPAISSAGWPLAVRFPSKSDAYKQQAKLDLLDSSEPRSFPVHPVQLYEGALAAGLCFFLARRFRGHHAPGNAALGMLLGYAVIRFGTEFLRADNKLYDWGLTFSQVVSVEILLFCLAAVSLRSTWRARRSRAVAAIHGSAEQALR